MIARSRRGSSWYRVLYHRRHPRTSEGGLPHDLTLPDGKVAWPFVGDRPLASRDPHYGPPPTLPQDRRCGPWQPAWLPTTACQGRQRGRNEHRWALRLPSRPLLPVFAPSCTARYKGRWKPAGSPIASHGQRHGARSPGLLAINLQWPVARRGPGVFSLSTVQSVQCARRLNSHKEFAAPISIVTGRSAESRSPRPSPSSPGSRLHGCLGQPFPYLGLGPPPSNHHHHNVLRFAQRIPVVTSCWMPVSTSTGGLTFPP